MAQAKPKAQRPLSPHLQIYRPMLTMMMSIFHRLTGVANYFGMAVLAWWLASMASGPESYAQANALLGSIPGRIVLFGLTWTALHHMLGGVRHLIWDTGRGFALPTVELMARLSIAGSLFLTLVVWFIAYRALGAL